MKHRKIIFPKDEKKHDECVEWWYFNGFLESKNAKFAYMSSLFKINMSKFGLMKIAPRFAKDLVKDYYFSHNILINLDTKEVLKDFSYMLNMSKESFLRPYLYIDYEVVSSNYVHYEIDEKLPFEYNFKNRFVDLDLKSKKDPLLENGDGFLSLNNDYTYYYSLTNLESLGLVNWKGKYIKVKGTSWHDHQWINNFRSDALWDWFSLFLNDGSEIVVGRVKMGDKWLYGATMIDTNGKQKHTTKVKFEQLESYKSKKTNYVYGTSWNINIPSWKFSVTTNSIIKDMEMTYSFIKYWEGPIEFVGKYNGKNISGRGFSEMIGSQLR